MPSWLSSIHLFRPAKLASLGSLLSRRALSSFKDPYSVLGVNRDASTGDIKKAYFELVKKYHPDTNKDPEASAKFIEIQNAYEILSDPKRKVMYDQYGATEETTAEQSAHGGPSASNGFGGATFDPSDLFRNIFSGGIFGRNFDPFGEGGFNGANLEAVLNLTFLEAVNGVSKTLSFTRLETCTSCSGRGAARGGKMTTCRTCKGTGQETSRRGGFLFSTPCRGCGGNGKINPDPCQACGGSGATKRAVSVNVDVPSGVNEGDIFSVRGEGNRVAGQAGDLLLQFNVDRSDIFTRKKNDIYVTLALNLLQAIVGGTVIVPTIHGSVEMKLAPGVQPDDVKKLSGKGIYNALTREQGHQYVKFKIEIPQNLRPEQMQLFRRALNPQEVAEDDIGSDGRQPFTATNPEGKMNHPQPQQAEGDQKQDKASNPSTGSREEAVGERGDHPSNHSPNYSSNHPSGDGSPLHRWLRKLSNWLRWY